MSKIATIYTCSKCDAQSPKWMGRCLECGEWGGLREAQVANNPRQIADSKLQRVSGKKSSLSFAPSKDVINLSQLQTKNIPRIKTGIGELDRILSGGVVPGTLILLGGEPGIGKSTLLLQVASSLVPEQNANNVAGRASTGSVNKGVVLYCSGEESAEQLKTRFDRLNISSRNIQYLGETNTESICGTIASMRPNLAIVDSIQTLRSEESESEAGGTTQIKIATAILASTAKETNVPIIIIGHVTKGGALAGPKSLEHLVDIVLEFSGDRSSDLRILRSIKNRYGVAGEMAFFEMAAHGLKEVPDPSKLLLAGKIETPGSVIGIVMEGTRALAVEFQSLLNRTNFGYPKRQAVGFDLNKLQLLAAVLTKRAGVNLNFFDAHLKIVGGFRISEPAADLPVALSMLSALKNKSVPPDTIAIGEVGLGGEIRVVPQIDKRLREAERLGFKYAIIPNCAAKSSKLKLLKIKNIGEAANLL